MLLGSIMVQRIAAQFSDLGSGTQYLALGWVTYKAR
jgi:hypothetical protein